MLYKQYNQIPHQISKSLIEKFLQEDSPDGDKTGEAIFVSNDKASAYLKVKSDTVLAGVQLLDHFFDERTKIEYFFKDGDLVNKGTNIVLINGSTSEILKKERIFLNLIQRMCGIANQTKQMSDLAKPFGVDILDTRKTTPGLRIFEKYAVTCGGGTNHRFDLSSGIMIKDNHIAASGSITSAVQKVKTKDYNLPIEVEVDTFEQLEETLNTKIDSILLDNFTPADTKKAIQIIRSHKFGKNIYVESSGGINLSNIKEYLDTGIDAISSGALTHSVIAADISLDFID